MLYPKCTNRNQSYPASNKKRIVLGKMHWNKKGLKNSKLFLIPYVAITLSSDSWAVGGGVEGLMQYTW